MSVDCGVKSVDIKTSPDLNLSRCEKNLASNDEVLVVSVLVIRSDGVQREFCSSSGEDQSG